MSGVKDIFEEYFPQYKNAKVSLFGDMRDWFWFKILVFTNNKINLIKELEILNNLLAKHEGNRYEEFSVCLDEFSISPEQSFGFISKKKNLKQCLLTLWLTFGQR